MPATWQIFSGVEKFQQYFHGRIEEIFWSNLVVSGLKYSNGAKGRGSPGDWAAFHERHSEGKAKKIKQIVSMVYLLFGK